MSEEKEEKKGEKETVTHKPKTDEELKQLAKDIWSGQVFTSNHLREADLKPESRMMHMVFVPLALAGQEAIDHLKEIHAALFYEYISEAGPRSINGYPMFFSMQVLTKEELDRLVPLINKVEEAMNSV